MNNKIIDYLVNNQEYLKELIEPIVIAKNHILMIDSLFTEEVMEQFNRKIKSDIANEVCQNLACDLESVLIELEKIDLMEYLK